MDFESLGSYSKIQYILDDSHNFHLNKLMSFSSLSPPQALDLIHQGTALLLTLIPDLNTHAFMDLGALRIRDTTQISLA